MTSRYWLYHALATALLAASCTSDDDDATSPDEAPVEAADASTGPSEPDAHVADAAAPVDAGIPRPEGWEDESHGRGAPADYDRLFPDDQVQRIDFTITPEARQTMLDNLEELLGEPGTGPMFGLQLDEKICAEKKTGDACDITEPQPTEGACRSFMPEGKLFCLPKSFGPPGDRNAMMGGRMGPLDLIGGDPEYVPVTVSYAGKRWEHVGLRYKGNSSLRGAWSQGRLKIGFRLNFDHYEQEQPQVTDQRFFGFSEMTFSSAYGDATMIRDKLAGEIAVDFGLKTARAAFYRVYVDSGDGPEYWGLYTMIEDPSDELIEAQFSDTKGNMYKPDGPGAYFAEFDEESFAKKTNQTEADYSDVMAAIDALNAPRDDAQAWRTRLEETFDVDNFIKVLAFSRATGHWDGYGVMAHNFYLYGDPSQGGRLVWISWDHNLTWQTGMVGPFADMTVMMDEVTDTWPLIRYLLDDEVYRARYVEALGQVLEGAYAKPRFDARAAELHALVAPYVSSSDEGEQMPYTTLADPAAFDNALEDPMRGLISAADARRAAVNAALADTP